MIKYCLKPIYNRKGIKEVCFMGMSDEQLQVYNALINFADELIDKEQDEKEREKLKQRKKNILANNKDIN